MRGATHYDITTGNVGRNAHCDITIGNDVTRDTHFDVIMSDDIVMFTHHDITMPMALL